MNRRSAPIGLAAVLAAACGHARLPVAEHAAARAQPSERHGNDALVPLLEKNCVTCHDQTPGRPSLTKLGEISPEVALRAALLISAGRMPPFPAEVPDGERTSLIDGLCELGAPSPEVCKRAYRFTRPAPFARLPATILRDTPGQASTPAGPAERMIGELWGGGLTWVRLNPTVMSYLVLLSDERCRGEGHLSDAAYAQCVKSLLAPQQRSLPPPPPGAGP